MASLRVAELPQWPLNHPQKAKWEWPKPPPKDSSHLFDLGVGSATPKSHGINSAPQPGRGGPPPPQGSKTTPILLFLNGRTTPKVHGSGSSSCPRLATTYLFNIFNVFNILVF
jgi:hypothetical protein